MVYPTPRTQGLVGREAELSALDELLAGVSAGESAAVVVSGEPGIGKSALIGAMLERSRDLGHASLSGRAAEIERDVPFAVFVDALERDVESLPPEPLRALDGDDLGLLATLFRSLAPASPALPERLQRYERQRLLRALHGLLEPLADGRPLVLALDDLHWADPASIDLICRLLHRGLRVPSLILLASRPAQSTPRLRAAFAEAERHGKAQQFDLLPLSAADAVELLGADSDPSLVALLHRESGGNPFYLEQLAAAARRGDAPRGAGESARPRSRVPAAVNAAIRGELDLLSPSARTLLHAAAVLGDPFEPDLASAVSGLGERRTWSDLDELLERGLIHATPSPRRFRFRHPIVGHAAYEDAGAGWRIDAHGRAAALLRTRGAAMSALAPHIERSARVGDAAAAAALAEAGQELMVRAPASAARWFGAALQLTPQRADNVELRVGLSAQRAIALTAVGLFDESSEELRRFLELTPREPSKLRQRAAALAARCDALVGRQEAARAYLLDELGRLPDKRSSESAELARELALTYVMDGQWSNARRYARDALAADCQGILRVGALAILALAELGLGSAWRGPLAEGGELFDRLSEEERTAHVLDATVWLAWGEAIGGRPALAIRHVEQALVISGALGHDALTVPLLAMKAVALCWLGRVPELHPLAETAMDAALLSDSEMYFSSALSTRALACLLSGDLRDAVRFAEESLAAATTSVVRDQARALLAEALLGAGEPKRCCAQFIASDGELSLPPLRPHDVRAYELLACAQIQLGELARAEDFAEAAARAAQRTGLDLSAAFAHRALACVALARGEVPTATTEADASCEAAERAGAPVEAARSRTLLGKALAAAGDRGAALDALRRSHETLLACGTQRYRDEAARELRKLGRAVPRPNARRDGTPDALGLTVREAEVMELVALGKTNGAIATDLVVSVRTVDRHVARIFDKLQVHSRAAAATTFERARQNGPE